MSTERTDLPTTPGLYRDIDGDVWRLKDDGSWWLTPVDDYSAPDDDLPEDEDLQAHDYLPFQPVDGEDDE